jgi:hypothetical protein
MSSALTCSTVMERGQVGDCTTETGCLDSAELVPVSLKVSLFRLRKRPSRQAPSL